MSKLYQDNEGWMFESDNGIKYSIYEGIGNGIKKDTCHSDIFFIVLDEYFEDLCSTEFVGWRYGYEFVTREDEDYIHIIEGIVIEFEKSHELIVQEIGKERPFIDDEEMMYDFFRLSRKEFLNVWGVNIRECDYDATAKIVAKKIASIKTWD